MSDGFPKTFGCVVGGSGEFYPICWDFHDFAKYLRSKRLKALLINSMTIF